MMSYRDSFVWLATVALAVLSVGCGGGDQLEVYPVKGQIMFEGKPLVGGGSIAFIPTTARPGKTAGGEIQQDGTYQLSTYTRGDGSIPGEFRVVITQIVEAEPDSIVDSDGTSNVEPTPLAVTVVSQSDRIPPIYSDHHNSPLTAQVEATTMNSLDFDLKR